MNFIHPINPGVHPIFQAGATDAQTSYTKREQEEIICKYLLFNATYAALKLHLTKVAEETYIQGIRNRITGYATRTTRYIMEYLSRTYGLVNPSPRNTNDQRFTSPLDKGVG